MNCCNLRTNERLRGTTDSLLTAHPGADLVHGGDHTVPALQTGPGVLVLVASDGDVTGGETTLTTTPPTTTYQTGPPPGRGLFRGFASPAVLCHKEPARRNQRLWNAK